MPEAKSQVLCRHCEHRQKMNRPLIEKCEHCAELRNVLKPKRKPKAKPEEATTTSEALKDDAEVVVPQRLIPVFALLDLFKKAERSFKVASDACKQIEDSPEMKGVKPLDGKKHYGVLFGQLRNAKYRMRAMRPSLVCPSCQDGSGCVKCNDTGFLTLEMADAQEIKP